jgi:UDP-N-acetylglucosamine--N-acetylmuramyl-(pentapeptide) pyrophosphoryl-undecaprenol N-acetylglucosamine transferase
MAAVAEGAGFSVGTQTAEATPPLRVILAGGGTGGHLFPAVAVAEALCGIDPGTEVLFVGTERGIEARVLPGMGLKLETLEVRPVKGGGLTGWVKGLLALPRAAVQAWRIVRRFRPDVVVSSGGYAAGPVTLVAALTGVPTALMEQNALPGLTNRVLGKLVDECLLSMPVAAGTLPAHKCEIVGNPLRAQILEAAANANSDADGRDRAQDFHLLVTGGSGGAGALNRDLPRALCALPADIARRLTVRHQAGRNRHEAVREAYLEFGGRVSVVEFINDMAGAYAWSDLAVCRAGATTLAELMVLGQPSLLIPFPGAADNHQERNALAIVEQGAGVMVQERDLLTGKLARLVTGFVQNPNALDKMAVQARGLGRPHAANEVASRLVRLGRAGR